MRKQQLLYAIGMIFIVGCLLFSACKKDKEEEPYPPAKKYAWAVGDADSTTYGMILFSEDGGISWTRKGEGADALKNIDLNDVYAINENVVWAISKGNIILNSTDGGQSWQQITPPSQETEIGLMGMDIYNNTDIWISGNLGTVYHSPDAGTTWDLIESDILNDNFLQGIHAASPEIVYAVGAYASNANARFLAYSVDAGQNWDTIASPKVHAVLPWIGAKSIGTENVVVYGGGAYYFSSQDAGQSWTYDSIPATGGGGTGGADINCLTMLNEDTWWTALDLDGISITENAGADWSAQLSPPPGNYWLFGIDYFDRQNAVIVGWSSSSVRGKLLYTNNGGQTWTISLQTKCWMNKVSTVK